MPRYLNENLPLTTPSFRSQANGYADVPRSLAGRSYYLHELATGSPPVDGEPFATPANPDGFHGLNLSGPPWGSAVLHPIAWIGGLKDPGVATMSGARPLTGSGIPALGSFSIEWWIKSRRYDPLPHDSGFVAPYSRGLIVLRGWASAGTITANIKTWSGSKSDGTKKTDTAAWSSTTPANVILDTCWFDLNPAGLTQCWLTIGNPDASDTLHITSVGVYQGAKRSH